MIQDHKCKSENAALNTNELLAACWRGKQYGNRKMICDDNLAIDAPMEQEITVKK